MKVPTSIQQGRARLDRFPAGWVIILTGFLAHLGLATGLLALAYTGNDQVSVVVSAFLVGIVVIAGLAALPSVLLLWLGRYQRIAAVIAALVGVGMLLINDAHPTVWPFPLALFLAAVRAWAGAGLDTEDLLQLDPGRFERVDPPKPGPRESSEGPSSEES
ncbi:hypothetical protein E6P09_18065 (plasmid) [Haloferax mediterranei ATCC 33500]|uniref:Uncharacterized protein n=1 Tax=Haloferax mediterranei (strain ATCC 33500 / DSM 1411 / JCM 8866 / NBRC 14739 / NCIMB 2177 / R-4) TaxID=523841 RepID=I3RA11_HALMT|nr:hypothetical protein [Haloferax mediterranei]AFK21071.1 hypothetical protein HFX_5239 [Haloferax mediterranei ATCC 33500]AHZ24073.1 hypothetical protein BM92_17855 [Haloferax mediterranei ATCC 33500]EMA05146.1 hypothetical protein C439_00065 [Haloferax mediterranei ATCC 33500]MDX5989778.1 hypothetical protein [Haloferax mediterranei ATCC 33500]QCQ77222.1 hypothetical protein E6P09_18065 [Haloferax mediterranei ATCC 33500]